MTRLVIAAAGGFGRELAAYARDAGFEVTGFLDDDPAAASALVGADAEAGLRGTIADYAPPEPGERVAIGLGSPRARLRVGALLRERGAAVQTIIHPRAWIAPSASVGEGTTIAPFACVGPSARIGELGLLNTYASLGHDARLGAGCVFSSYAVATGHTALGDAVFLGTAAVIAPGQRVGDDARVSAGAVAFREVPAGHLAAGNPARSRAIPASA